MEQHIIDAVNAVWQSRMDADLRAMTRGEFCDTHELAGEDAEEAWQDFADRRDRVFGE